MIIFDVSMAQKDRVLTCFIQAFSSASARQPAQHGGTAAAP
eukprot:COSAG06_NODE_51038_length_314_cov_1.739535_1_plen_40_part_01